MSDQDSNPVPEENFFDFTCPHCSQTISFPESSFGQANECPNCGETIVVPKSEGGAARSLPIPITTNRLTLRRFQTSDFDDLNAFMADEELFAFIEMNPMNETEIEEWLERDAYVRFTSPDQPLFLAVTRNDTGHAIGWAALHIEPRLRRQATLNMMIDRKHQRNGFGSEAMGGVLEFCFKGVHLHRVAISCDGRNAAAARMAEKAGLRYEAQFVEDRPNGDAWTDTLWFAMLEREYPSAGKKSEADSAEINATR